MKIKIAYFTSTGNTLWLCNKAKEFLEAKGHTVNLYEIIKEHNEFKQAECDLMGFFYPVWGSNPPDPMVEYRDDMSFGDGKKVFIVGNCCALNGDTGHLFKKILDEKGYDVFLTDHLYMPTNFNLPYEPENKWKRVPLEDERNKILCRAEVKLSEICNNISDGVESYDGKSFMNHLAGALQRKTYWMGDGYKSHFSIAEDKCIHCDLCIRMCPTNNITKDENGKKVFGDKCILCVKCYNLCPKDAVLICKASIDDEKYRRYKGPNEDIKPVEYR
jgi:ferredoxin/flavodoxin